MSDSELKPCVYCGNNRNLEVSETYGKFYIVCPVCAIATEDHPTREQAVASWNSGTRLGEEALHTIRTRYEAGSRDIPLLLQEIDGMQALINRMSRSEAALVKQINELEAKIVKLEEQNVGEARVLEQSVEAVTLAEDFSRINAVLLEACMTAYLFVTGQGNIASKEEVVATLLHAVSVGIRKD